MRTRRNAIVLGASLAAHLALLAVWMSTRPDLTLAESPTLEVQLVRLPPKAAPAPREAPPRPTPPVSSPRPLEIHQPPPLAQPPPPTAPAPSEISPEWRVKRSGGGVDLDAAPFVLGRAGLKRAREPKADCKTHGWDRPVSCPPDATELAASKGLGEKDPGHSGFAYEARRKEAIKDYKATIGGEYTGLRCTFLHTHC